MIVDLAITDRDNPAFRMNDRLFARSRSADGQPRGAWTWVGAGSLSQIGRPAMRERFHHAGDTALRARRNVKRSQRHDPAYAAHYLSCLKFKPHHPGVR